MHLGSKSSTKVDWQASWGSSIKTKTRGANFEARLTLQNPISCPVTAVLVMGDDVQVKNLQLEKNYAIPLRMEEGEKSSTRYDLRALG